MKLKLIKLTGYLIIFWTSINLLGCQLDKVPNPNTSLSHLEKAEENELNQSSLINLISEIKRGTYGEVHSLLINKNHQTIIEEYFHGYTPDQLHNIYSVTKSISSALVGIAIDNKQISGVESPLLGFFPEYSIIDNWDGRKSNITLEHVLTMSTGFEWDEWTYGYEDVRNINYQMSVSDDMIKFVLDQPIINPPGEKFSYTSGGSTLLSGIISSATLSTAEEFASQMLFSKLGIADWEWWKGKDGLPITGWGLLMKPRDMMKIGMMFAYKGVYDSEQIISQEWIDKSTSNHIYVDEYRDYAYQWWRYSNTNTVNDLWEQNDVFYANGYGGQFIWVLPHLDMVIVSTAGNYTETRKSEAMLWEHILPSVKK